MHIKFSVKVKIQCCGSLLKVCHWTYSVKQKSSEIEVGRQGNQQEIQPLLSHKPGVRAGPTRVPPPFKSPVQAHTCLPFTPYTKKHVIPYSAALIAAPAPVPPIP